LGTKAKYQAKKGWKSQNLPKRAIEREESASVGKYKKEKESRKKPQRQTRCKVSLDEVQKVSSPTTTNKIRKTFGARRQQRKKSNEERKEKARTGKGVTTPKRKNSGAIGII